MSADQKDVGRPIRALRSSNHKDTLAELRVQGGEQSGSGLVRRSLLASLAGKSFQGDRDLYDTCGYPRYISPSQYLEVYLRQDLAQRIVNAYPDASWHESPLVYAQGENPNDRQAGMFSDAVWRLNEVYKLWEKTARVDRLSNIGHYGVLLLGLDGGEPMWTPARRRDYRLLYLKAHTEVTAPVSRWETDARSPRYGKPSLYNITIGSASHASQPSVVGPSSIMRTDWSRVVHVAENPLDDDSVGTPRLEAVFNRLMDVDKLLGGSAEVFWQNAAGIWSLKADPELSWEPEEKEELENQIEELTHGLRRWLRLRGVEAQNLAAEVGDPASAVEKELDIIAGTTGIPKRILIGSERGELASSQDEENWAGRINTRREKHVVPNLIRPVIDRLIALGVLPEPAGGRYEVEWPESDALGEAARADIANKKATTLSLYTAAVGAELIVPPREFRSKFLGLEPEPAPEDALIELPQDEDLGPEAVDTFNNRQKKLKKGGFRAMVARLMPRRRRVANIEARTLYVCRPVLNWREIATHFRKQGLVADLGSDMHVTIAFSRAPVDWMKVGDPNMWQDPKLEGKLTVQPGGARVVEPLGDKGAVVLMFTSGDLTYRWRQIRECGASWDWGNEYQPHITLTYDAAGVDLDDVEPWRGAIELGPEVFEELDEDWADKHKGRE